MGAFISLVENLAYGLYVLAGLVLVLQLRAIFIARGELRFAQYGLEKELAEQRGGRAITLLLLMIELMVAVWAISTLASPTWNDGIPDTPIVNADRDFRTSTPIGGGSLDIDANAGPTAGPGILATAPPPSTPIGTIGPSEPRRGCDPDVAWIQIPANGQFIFEEMDIIGTANSPDFSKYRFEIRGMEEDQFSVYTPTDFTSPVVDGVLGRVFPLFLIPDREYRFRLMVFNNINEVVGSCEITIWITDPQPTATPIGGGVQQ